MVNQLPPPPDHLPTASMVTRRLHLLLFFCHKFYLDFCLFVIFMLNLNLLGKQVESHRHREKGCILLEMGADHPQLRLLYFVFSRSLSLFLKGTCNLLLGQSCVLLRSISHVVFLGSGLEPSCVVLLFV